MNVFRIALAVGAIAGFAADSSAREVHWERDLNRAARESARTRKPMLLRFTTSWCGYCKKMLATTFRDERVVEQINGCFIPVVVDGDTNPRLSKSLGVTGFPTTLIVSPKLKVVKKIVGYQSAEAMRKHLGGMCHPPGPAAATAAIAAGDSAAGDRPRFGGYCLVGMLDDRRLKRGDPKHAARYRGRIYWFASAENLRRFASDPAKYLPGNDGVCPVTMVDERSVQMGRPEHAVIYHGRLWFLAKRACRKTFASAPRRYAELRTASRE